MKKYKVISVMSGTSCDGLDLAYCEFKKNKTWQYKILKCKTIKYNQIWIKKISKNFNKINDDLIKLDYNFGVFISQRILSFIKKNNLHPDLICSHGHTVIHQPNKKTTFQIGCGNTIAKLTKTTTVNNFRIKDIELGGQGAPLVPIGDFLLFQKYKYCLNLGGFANISKKINNNIIGYDICPCNIVLNFYAQKKGFLFDNKGLNASKGRINHNLLTRLNNLKYYKIKGPKSLDLSWVKKHFIPCVEKYNINLNDKLKTISKHISIQIGKYTKDDKMLITGGGSFNKTLIEMISSESLSKIHIPDNKLINYKEAIIFGLIGVLKKENEINCYKSVTGATKNSVVGVINYYS